MAAVAGSCFQPDLTTTISLILLMPQQKVKDVDIEFVLKVCDGHLSTAGRHVHERRWPLQGPFPLALLVKEAHLRTRNLNDMFAGVVDRLGFFCCCYDSTDKNLHDRGDSKCLCQGGVYVTMIHQDNKGKQIP